MTQIADEKLATGLPAGTWRPVPGTGHVGFEVRTMWGLARVRGAFERYAGALVVEGDQVKAELTIEADSLDTANPKRNAHLRSADFFDVERHPVITFTSHAIKPGPAGLVIEGELTIGDRRLQHELDVELTRTEDGALHLSTETMVDRTAAGLDWNRAGMITGDALLRVELELALEAEARVD